MHAVVHGERTLTDLDFARLTKLLNQELPPPLADVLASAEVTGSRAVPADIVTMNSRVELLDVQTHQRQTLTLCYPRDAEPAAGFISVLSPVGNSLLGMKCGTVAKWNSPMGDECAAEIVAIVFQPEASGDFST